MTITAAQLVGKVAIEGDAEAKQKLSGVSQAVKETSGGFKTMLGNALSFAGGMAIFNLASQAVGLLKDQVVDMFKVTMAHQDVLAQTAQVIKSTGDASGLSAKAVNNLAEALGNTTRFGDDTVQTGENMLLTFTNIGKTVFPQATKTMLDMSQALGQDVKSSAIQLGKALNDPLTGITALSRVGVTFDNDQKKLIKTYMQHGDVAKAQGVILKELQREFGGSAQAAGDTFAGKLDILKNRFDELKEKIGGAIMPILSQFLGQISSNVMPLLSQFGDWFTKNALPSIQQFIGFVESQVAPKLLAFGANLSKFFAAFGDAGLASLGKQIGGDLAAAFMKLLDIISSPQFGQFVAVVGQALAAALKFVIPIVVELAKTIGQFIADVVTRLQPMITEFSKVWAVSWQGVSLIFKGVWDEIVGLVKIAWALVSGIIKIGLDLLSGNWQAAWNDFLTMLSGIWDGIKQFLWGQIEAIGGLFDTVWSQLAGKVSHPFEIAWAQIQQIFGNITGFINSIGSNISSSLHNAHIPGFATGTSSAPGGLSMLGENEPEVVVGPQLGMLPRGAQVIPFSQLGGGRPQIIVYVQQPDVVLDGYHVARKLMPHIVANIRNATGVSHL